MPGVVKPSAAERFLDSPGDRAQSPAWKRRKVHTPVRFQRSTTSSSDDLLEEGGGGGGDENDGYRPGSTRKALFDTPDSKCGSRTHNNAVDFGTPEGDADCLLSGARQSNVNPFYTNLNDASMTSSSTCASQTLGKSFGRDLDGDQEHAFSPEATMLFGSPGTAHRCRRRRARTALSSHSSSGSVLSDDRNRRAFFKTRRNRDEDDDDDDVSDCDSHDENVQQQSPAEAGQLCFSSSSLLHGGDQTVRKPARRRAGANGGVVGPLFFDGGESPVPVMPSTAKKPVERREAPPTPVLAESPGPATPCSKQSLSPSELCNQLKRTCSVSGKGSLDEPRAKAAMAAACASPARLGSGETAHDDGLIDEEEEIASSIPRHFLRGHATASPMLPPHSPLPSRTPCPASTLRGRAARRARGISECSSGAGGSLGARSRFKEEFEEVGILGTGTFGTVFKCRNRLDGCLYAVKVTKQRFKGRADRERVLKEVFALSALCNEEDSPHIVRYFGAFVEDGRLFIQTELCDKSLQDMVRSKSYPNGLEAAARVLARQVLEGLSSIHKHNLVHLDIKPANIFVKNGVFKVGDLGHACLARIQTSDDDDAAAATAAAQGSSSSSSSSSGGGADAFPDLAADSSSPLRADSRLPRPPPLGASPDTSSSRSAASICDASRTPLRRMRSLRSVDASSPSRLMVDSDQKKPPRTGPQQHKQPPKQQHPAYVQDVEEGDSRYMALEILDEDYRQLTKGDIFSLGASLYEMCLGRELPANGPEWHEIRNGVLCRDALDRVSQDMQSLIRLMLGKDPVARPSAEALLVSGGPGGILRTAWETQLARERAAADEYRKELARMKASNAYANASFHHQQADPGSFDDAKYRMRRSNTM